MQYLTKYISGIISKYLKTNQNCFNSEGIGDICYYSNQRSFILYHSNYLYFLYINCLNALFISILMHRRIENEQKLEHYVKTSRSIS